MIKILVTTGPWYKPEWTENVLAIDKYVNDENYEMSHFKKTCPNPHSGESVHSQPIEGAILDPLTKVGMYVTNEEYEMMLKFTEECDKLIIAPHQLSPNIIDKYKGHIQSQPYNI